MSDYLKDVSTDDLAKELSERGAMPMCRCHRWQTYLGIYDADGYTLRCHGCLRAVAKCTCG